MDTCAGTEAETGKYCDVCQEVIDEVRKLVKLDIQELRMLVLEGMSGMDRDTIEHLGGI